MGKLLSTAYLVVFAALNTVGQQPAIISGTILNGKTDTLKLVLLRTAVHTEKLPLPLKVGQFRYEMSLTEPCFYYLTDGTHYINGLLEPGDNYSINFDPTQMPASLQFTGKGNEKSLFFAEFIRLNMYKKLLAQVPAAKQMQKPFDRLFYFIDSTESSWLERLDQIKPLMSAVSYQMLQSEVKSSFRANRYRSVGLVYHESISETMEKRKGEFSDQSLQTMRTLLSFDTLPVYTYGYVNNAYNLLFMDYDNRILTGKAGSGLPEKYNYLASMLPEGLKVPVFTLFLEYDIQKLNQSEDIEALIQRIYTNPADSLYKNYVTSLYDDNTVFKKGMAAPGFVLEDENGKKVSLASLKGKTIFLDFWYGACGPCHALFKILQPVKTHFAARKDVVFLCVSIDKKETWKAALAKYKITGFHTYTENKGEDHPIIGQYRVSGYPTSCLIDGNGNIFSANPSHKPEELIRQIEEATQVK